MKKIIYMYLAGVLFALASCGGSENKNETAKDSAASAAAASKADSILKMSSDTTATISADTTKK